MARPHVADKALYLTSLHDLPDAVISLYTGTYTLFTSLQRIVASSYQLPTPGHPSKADIVLGPPEAETITHMRRIVAMYLEEVSKVTGAPDLDVRLCRNVWDERLTSVGREPIAVSGRLSYHASGADSVFAPGRARGGAPRRRASGLGE